MNLFGNLSHFGAIVAKWAAGLNIIWIAQDYLSNFQGSWIAGGEERFNNKYFKVNTSESYLPCVAYLPRMAYLICVAYMPQGKGQ